MSLITHVNMLTSYTDGKMTFAATDGAYRYKDIHSQTHSQTHGHTNKNKLVTANIQYLHTHTDTQTYKYKALLKKKQQSKNVENENTPSRQYYWHAANKHEIHKNVNIRQAAVSVSAQKFPTVYPSY